MEAVALPGLGHELLDGLAFRGSPGFELWLENERRHIAGMASAVLHQAALALLARGEADGAVNHATELVRLNPTTRTHTSSSFVACWRRGTRMPPPAVWMPAPSSSGVISGSNRPRRSAPRLPHPT
jgi:hypothetical protein